MIMSLCFIAFLDVFSTKNGYQNNTKNRTPSPPRPPPPYLGLFPKLYQFLFSASLTFFLAKCFSTWGGGGYPLSRNNFVGPLAMGYSFCISGMHYITTLFQKDMKYWKRHITLSECLWTIILMPPRKQLPRYTIYSLYETIFCSVYWRRCNCYFVIVSTLTCGSGQCIFHKNLGDMFTTYRVFFLLVRYKIPTPRIFLKGFTM